jgi:hypothetical protein
MVPWLLQQSTGLDSCTREQACMHMSCLLFLPFLGFACCHSHLAAPSGICFPSPLKSYALFCATSLAYDAASQATSQWNSWRSGLFLMSMSLVMPNFICWGHHLGTTITTLRRLQG